MAFGSIRALPSDQAHLAARLCELHRIAQQIEEDLIYLQPISHHRRILDARCLERERQTLGFCLGFHDGCQIIHDVAHLTRLGFQGDLP